MKTAQAFLLALALCRAAASPAQAIQARQSTTPNGVTWEKATCIIKEVTDASIDQAKRWNAVDTEDAWTAAVKSWKSGAGNGLTFTQQISNFFHGPDQMFCGNEGARDGCASYSLCNNVKAPGGMFILNSFVAVSSMNYNFYDAIRKAEASISASMGKFASTFAPIDDMSAGMKLALDLVGFGFALAVAPMWNSALKGVPFFASNGNTLGTLKDTINPMVSNGITIAKDTSIPSQTVSNQNTLSNNLDILVKTWVQTLDTFNNQLFNGSDPSNKILYSMITQGKVLEAGFQEDALFVQNLIEKAIYGYLIPQAWPKSNRDLHSFIMYVQSPLSFTKSENAMLTNCHGNMYYLMSVSGIDVDCTGGGGEAAACTNLNFQVLPGVDTIDGKNWGRVTRDDFVAGAVETFKANGNKNGAKALDITNGDAVNSVVENGLRAPGVVLIPVCTAKEAWENWNNHGRMNNQDPPNYPCN